MKIILAHPGTQYSYQLAKQLHKKGFLSQFHTGIAYGTDHWVYRICLKLPTKLFNKISNRFVNELPDKLIKRHFFNEAFYLILLRLNFNTEKIIDFRNTIFQYLIPAKYINESDLVIGFDTSSLILIKRCRKNNIPFILDVSIGHPKSKSLIYSKIKEKYPEWTFSIKDKKIKYLEKEIKEIELASHIVVASSFSLKTYVDNGISASKISINPYGVDINIFNYSKTAINNHNNLNFVFVGLVDARKGIPLLINAWNKINTGNSTLTIIGPIDQTTRDKINKLNPNIVIKGRISLLELSHILPTYDVMIFPSFFEGFGLVIPEAMACGLPVITTDTTCGKDIINDGVEGFIINSSDENSLIRAIDFFISNPQSIHIMGAEARKRIEKLNWDNYGEKWINIISSLEIPTRESLLPKVGEY